MEATDQENNNPRKPKQVTQAFYLLLGSSAISLLLFIANAILFWQEYYSSQPMYAIFWSLVYIIPFWIAFKINAGRNWARWVLVVGTGISLFDIPNQLRGFANYPAQATLSLISFALVLFAIYLLFQSPANAWFKYQAANEIPYDPFIAEKSRLSGSKQKPWKITVPQGKKDSVAKIIASIAGFIGSIFTLFVTLYFFPYEDDGSGLPFYALICISLVGGAIAGGLVAGVREIANSRMSTKPVAAGFIIGFIGAAIGLVVLFVFALAAI